MALLTTAVYAVPICDSSDETRAQRASTIQPREPRIIPDTEHYLADVLDMLGVPSLDSSNTPSSTPSLAPTPTIQAEEVHPQNIMATSAKVQQYSPSPSPTTSADEVTFTTTIKNGKDKPFKNIQIGSGWEGKNRVEASDVPFIMDAVYGTLADRFNDLVDSSDELGLNK
ncbi:hypothetical protein N7478_005251 [Penicillium angulare]|uniref:uncharacterized protein n=1 Tax=Penicillium angulare TaxID=116970 RepID=UPI0025414361|nr:uncharacterized protein N7478_005251 [Penicillium angulare]KAJ5279879.1 hypothetical protein N7478_005251 [Penicillium angulare]